MNINFVIPMQDLAGNPIKDTRDEDKDVLISRVIGNLIANKKPHYPILEFGLCQKIYQSKGEIEINDEERNVIIETIEDAEANLPVLTVGQIKKLIT